MKNKKKYFCFIFLISCFCFFSCGDQNTTTADTAQTILIQNNTFVPESISAQAGETVFFVNEDSIVHHILSESAADLFDDTGDIDSLLIPAGTTLPVVLSDTLVSGSVLLFYDDILKEIMTTPNGEITIE